MFISEATISSFRALHKTAMMDECELLKHRPGGPDKYNKPGPATYTTEATLPCSFAVAGQIGSSATKEAMGLTEVALLDAVVSFDLTVEVDYGVSISNLDRIRITRLHGDSVAPVIYAIDGQVQRDNVAIVAALRKVTE